MPSPQQEEAAIKKKYGGIMPRKTPLISKDHERAYFDSADWALGKQGGNPQKPKGPLEALRPKLQVQKLNLIACNKYLLLLVLCSLGINHQVQAWMISILCDFCNNSRNHTSVFASSFTHTTELSIPDIFSLHLSFFFVFWGWYHFFFIELDSRFKVNLHYMVYAVL